MTTESLQVGQQVYVEAPVGERYYTLMTVIKKTPAGKVDLQRESYDPERFRADGYKEEGYSYTRAYNRERIDDEMSVVNRTEWLAALTRTKAAHAAIRTIAPLDLSRWPDKQSLAAEVARLQGLLDTARALVEAI